MRKRLAQKILSRLVRHGDAIDIYGKQRCVTAYRLYYGYYMFYRIKYAAFKLPEQGPDWKTICTNMYYKRFHKFGVKNCSIYATFKLPEQGPDWKTICTNMYYMRFHKFGAKTCRIRLTPKCQ